MPAGLLLTPEAYPARYLRVFQQTLREHDIAWEFPVSAHVQGSSGSAVLGGASTRGHDVTELDRETMSAIASFASYAMRNS